MSGNRPFLNITPVTKNLIIINVIVWGAMMLFPHRIGERINHFGALYYWGSENFNLAQLFSYMFMHSTRDFTHLLFNMFTLFMFGTAIETAVGPKRFLFYYIACGVGAALVQEGVYTLMVSHELSLLSPDAIEALNMMGANALQNGQNFADPNLANANLLINSPTVGASGAIYGVLLAFGMLFPNQRIFMLFFPVPIKAKYMVIGWGVMELLLGLASSGDGVAHFCHLGGMIAGIFIILYWKRKGDIRGPYY